jgi:hypothetical protein
MYHSCVVRKAGYLHLFKDPNTTREIILVKRLYNYDDSHNLLKASVTTTPDGKWEAKPLIENDQETIDRIESINSRRVKLEGDDPLAKGWFFYS